MIWVIKIKEEKTVEHPAHIETRNRCTVSEEKDHFEDLGVNGRTVSNMYYINNIGDFGFDSPGMSRVDVELLAAEKGLLQRVLAAFYYYYHYYYHHHHHRIYHF